MTTHWLGVACAAMGLAMSAGPVLSAQGTDTGKVASTVRVGGVEVGTLPALARIISVNFDRVRLADALRRIAEQGGVELTYAVEAVPQALTVTATLERVTVRHAFQEVLRGTGLDLFVSDDGHVAIARRTEHLPILVQGTGTIAGHVTDGALKAPLSAVSVRIEGTTLGTTADADGKYRIAGVAPGTYRVAARRVGYQPLTKDITVGADQSVTLDFALVAAPTRLDEVVTTAVGQQRRYEVGNDISTINADSIAPTAPITSLTDLISARAPGVTVLETSGMTGSGEAIRIEGLTSLVLQNDPILIVDGVRQDNSAGEDISATLGFNGGTHPTPSRLNDIDFSDISTIDILKGPAASTEYGTDAANGVIVVTTKHGTAGAPQWRASAEQTESDMPVRFPTDYYSWGHATDGTNTAVNCLLATAGVTGIHTTTSGNCIVDSVTQWNPLNHSATSIFGTGNRGRYDLSVSGGSEAVRYFISGGLSNETGLMQMPAVFRELADTAGVGLPRSALSSNSEQQRSVRVNTAIKLGPTADLTATASYLSTYQQTPDAEYLYYGLIFAPALGDPAHYYGYDLGGSYAGLTPLSQLSEIGSQATDRVTGGLTANWRPTGWFIGHATTGLDHGSQTSEEINYPLANTAYQFLSPFLGLAAATTDVYSVDLRGTATAAIGHGIRAVTSGGLQMVDTRVAGQTAYAQNITVTNLTLNGAPAPTVTQLGTRQATLGAYGEEQLSLSDRLFLTGALRADAGSGFGGAYSVAEYPKASVSWLALSRGPTTLRVRGAFGESGVQPTNGAALQLYTPTVAALGPGGGTLSVNQISWPGNPNLRPERSAEFEGGVDVGAWGNRVSLALTGYSKVTHDALVNVNLGETFNNATYQENIGEVRNTGLEGSITLGVVQARSVAWDGAVNASANRNVLVSLAPGVTAQTVYAFATQYRQAVGYPLYGIWAQPVTYADANHDGIIEPSEVKLSDSAQYIGPSLPTQEVSLSTHLALWRGAVTVGGLLDYRGGYKIVNEVAYYEDEQIGDTPGTNHPRAPLWLQARAVAANAPFYANPTPPQYDEDGSFLRVREVSLTYSIPRSLIRVLRMQNLSATAAVRNLALLTRYTGADPEVTNTQGANVQYAPTTGGYSVNNDVRGDLGAVPLARYWVLRLNVGL